MHVRSLRTFLYAIALQWCTTAGAIPLATISGFYVFGDSLSDQGNVYAITGQTVPPAEYSDGVTFGRFTNGLRVTTSTTSRLTSGFRLPPRRRVATTLPTARHGRIRTPSPALLDWFSRKTPTLPASGRVVPRTQRRFTSYGPGLIT